MPSAHPHWRRSAIVASIGLLIATGSIVWIGLVVRTVGPKTLSLAYRIDAEKTLAFTRSPDRETFERRMRMLTTLLEPNTNPPDTKALPAGLSYEYALIDTGSGTTAWIMGVRQKNQMDQWMTEPQSQLTLLPTKNIKQSLGALPFFRSNEGTASVTVTYIPLQQNERQSSSSILDAILSPYDAMLIAEHAEGKTKMILRKMNTSAFTNNALLKERPSEETALLSLIIARPAALLSSLQSLLGREAPKTLEGLTGIAKAILERTTHRSDLESAIQGLLKENLRLSVKENEEGKSLFLLSADAASKEIIDLWEEAVNSIQTPVVIRTQKFLHGDSRTDVSAAPKETSQSVGNWKIRTIGSGSAMNLSIATEGRTIVITNDPVLLEKEIDEREKPMTVAPEHTRGVMTGTMSMSWLIATLEQFNDTEGVSRLLQSIAGTETGTMRWQVTDYRNNVTIEFPPTETRE